MHIFLLGISPFAFGKQFLRNKMMKFKNLLLLLLLQLIIFGWTKGENVNYSKSEISTSLVSEITYTTATCGGNLTNDGCKKIIAKGLVWHTSANATLEVNTGKTTEAIELGEYVSSLNALTANTKYFVRAYVTNELGTVYGEEKEFTTSKEIVVEMISVEGGSFQMGSEDGFHSEMPIHTVSLDRFEIGKYEITQAQWVAVMGSNPSCYSGDNRPVEKVSWNDVQTFISKLNEQTGKTYRLPTEAEWEFAARGGVAESSTIYAGSSVLEDVAWYRHNAGYSRDVGTKQANELGIYDMSGNVWEWCSDCFDFYSSSPANNPQGPALGSTRIIRGGSNRLDAISCRVFNRSYYDPSTKHFCVGFRLARSL